jgi:WD40 repeat protein
MLATLTGFVASIFQVSDGRVLQHIGRRTQCMAYSPDGRLFVTAGGTPDNQDNEESLIQLWDVSSDAGLAKALCRFTRHASAVLSATFSPDGRRLATGDADGAIKIWDVTAPLEVKVELHTLRGHVKAVTGLAFSPDGTRLASGGADRTVRLWDTRSGQEIKTYRGHGNDAFHALGYPEGVRYRDGVPFAVAPMPSLEGNYQNAVFSVAFSPDGTRLASASADGTVKLWNAGFGQQPRIIKDFANSVTVSPDGARVALASTRGTVLLCDTRTGGVLHELRGLEKSARREKGDRVTQVAFSPDSARLAATGAEGIVKIWDTSTGRELLSFRAHGYLARGVKFSPDGTRLATAGFKDEHHLTAEVKLWDATGGQEIRTIPLEYNYTSHFLAFSPDWNRLALTEQQGWLLYIWDVNTGQEIRQFRKSPPPADNSTFTTLAFSGDGMHVALGFTNGKVELWDAGAGHVVRTLQGNDAVVAVRFTPEGKRLVSGHRDGAVKLWDMATGQEVRTLRGHIRSIKSLSFSKDGTRLASAGWDGTVRIWDTRPWTPAIGIELEAAALVDSLIARPLPKSVVKSVIQKRLHLGDAVRRLALEFADHHAEETDPLKYYVAAWPVLRHPHANEYMAESALAQMTAATRLVAEEEAKPYRGSYKNYVLADGEVAVQKTNQRQDHAFLGMAHYRMGRFKKEHYKEALAVLTKCNPHRPATAAFLAMTHHQLGQKAQAEAALSRLRDLMKTAGSAQDRAFLAEAEALSGR